jgi:hypothetical protein
MMPWDGALPDAGVACAAPASKRRLRSNCARPNQPATATQQASAARLACAAAPQGQIDAAKVAAPPPSHFGRYPDTITSRGVTHNSNIANTTTSRTLRRESRRSIRLRAPDASSKLNARNSSAALTMPGQTPALPAAGFASIPATPAPSTITISPEEVRRSSTSTRKSCRWGIG